MARDKFDGGGKGRTVHSVAWFAALALLRTFDTLSTGAKSSVFFFFPDLVAST